MDITSLHQRLNEYAKKVGSTYVFSKSQLHIVKKRAFLAPKRPSFSVNYVGYLVAELEPFRVSPGILDLFCNGRKVVVNKKAAYLFLCGRDLHDEAVIKGTLRGQQLVVDEQENVLGLADGKKNLLDKGVYLRRELRTRNTRAA